MPYKNKNKALENSRKSYHKRMEDKVFKESRRAKRNENARNWYKKHRERLYSNPRWVEDKRKAKREYARRNPEVGRAWKLRTQYGLSLDEYKKKLEEQENRCPICYNMVERPHVDHNHITGQTRDLLCGSCNMGLGMFKDNQTILENAILYLKRWV